MQHSAQQPNPVVQLHQISIQSWMFGDWSGDINKGLLASNEAEEATI